MIRRLLSGLGAAGFAVGAASCGISDAETSDCPGGRALGHADNVTVAVIDPDGVADVGHLPPGARVDIPQDSVLGSVRRSPHATEMVGIVSRCAVGVSVMSLAAATNGVGSAADGAQAIRRAVVGGADVVVVGFGVAVDHAGLADAVAEAESAGVLVVAPAGNTRQPSEYLSAEQARPVYAWNEPVYPAAYSTVVAVGALDGSLSKPADFSQSHPYVDVVAAGSEIGVLSSGETATGTSFAAPFVAAAVAVFVERSSISTPPELLRELVRSSVTVPAAWSELGAPDRLAGGAGVFDPWTMIDAAA